MNTSNTHPTGHRRPGAFSSRPPSSQNTYARAPPDPSESDDSASPQRTSSREQSSPRPARPSIYPNQQAASSSTSFSNFSRPAFARQGSAEPPSRLSGGEVKGHRRQHSQGFFEPSLPSASISDQSAMNNLSASQIAAQAAMHHGTHSRQRSQTIPSPQNSPPGTLVGRRKPPPIQTAGPDASKKGYGPPTPVARQPYNGLTGGSASAAATAATAAYPGKLSPGLSGFESPPPPPPPEKEHRLRSEKSKLKLFSKPKDRSNKEVEKPLPSPNRFDTVNTPVLGKFANQSTTSLADSLNSAASSLYSVQTGNASTSTLVPSKKSDEKEKKHHFLSRQKNKLRDKIGDDHSLQLSSTGYNSRSEGSPALHSFQQSPASPATTSFTGLDLRHAGRAVREKKREEKTLPFAPKITDIDKIDFAGNGRSTPAPSLFGPSSSHAADLPSVSTGINLHNLRPEDAWGFLRAKLLSIFDADDVRIPIEDLNRLVTQHLQLCIRLNNPTAMVEDLRSLLNAGFTSLDHSLRPFIDQRLVPHLVDSWLFVFGTLLPFIQAVFLPLDLEFKGHGPLLTAKAAAEFWGANPDSATSEAFGHAFDVRRIVLLCYRDTIILPRYETLKDKFSRLSLDSIATAASPIVDSFDTLTSSSARPSTSDSHDPTLSASYNSQTSTLYDASNPSRSRGNSNLSAPELPPFAPTSQPLPSVRTRQHVPQRLPDSSQVTETVGRMLQCVSVLASAQSADEGQKKMEDLARSLKLNWLGRGRVGRNRRGIVGGKGGGGGGAAGFGAGLTAQMAGPSRGIVAAGA